MRPIAPEYKRLLDAAKSEKRTIRKGLKRLKQRPPKDLDKVFSRAHEEVFEEVDCLECANCCKTTSPIFRDKDIDRLSVHLGLRPAAFIERFLRMDSDSDYVLLQSPCAFLQEDNTCSVYEYRPKACREYPHTDRRKMIQILDLTAKNTEICPAAYRVVKEVLGSMRG